MKIEYDHDVDALYIRLQEKHVSRTVEVEEGLNIDFDAQGRMIGLEVLDATTRYSIELFEGQAHRSFNQGTCPNYMAGHPFLSLMIS